MNPYKYVLDAIVIAALCAGVLFGVHKYNTYQQDIGEARKQAQWDADTLRRNAVETDLKAQIQKDKDDAVAQATKSTQAALVASNAAIQSNRVLDGTLKALLAASTTGDVTANRKYTAALSAIFSDCKEKYRQLGQDAQGHAIDALMFQQAWPTAAPAQPAP